MGMRRIKPNAACEVPARVMVAYGEWTTERGKNDPSVRIDTLSKWTAFSFERREGGYGAPARHEGDTVGDLWLTVDKFCRPKQRTWLFGHGLSQQASILGVYSEIESSRLRWQPDLDADGQVVKGGRPGALVCDGIPWLLSGRYKGRSIRIVDVLNYSQSTLDELNASLGPDSPIAGPIAGDSDKRRWGSYGAALVLATFVRRFLDNWAQRNLGNFQATAGKLAMNAFRHFWHRPPAECQHRRNGKRHVDGHAVGKVPIMTHDMADVKSDERAAFFGGRVEAYRIGELPGTWHYLDVRAMYPYVASKSPMPVSHVSTLHNVSIGQAAACMSLYVAIADCTVSATNYRYPYRMEHGQRVRIIRRSEQGEMGQWHGDRMTVYPEGRYRTWLAGEELCMALRAGDVQHVHKIHLYERGNPFRSFFDYWWKMRCGAEDSGDKISAGIAKLVMNSLIGKFAQRSARWIDRPDLSAPVPWGQFYYASGSAEQAKKFRSIGHNVQEKGADQEVEWSAVAVASCVTAAARVHLYELEKSLPASAIALIDTDGMIVSDPGYEVAQSLDAWSERRPGGLRLKSTVDSLAIAGPRHYRWGDRWTLAGVTRGWEWTDASRAIHWIGEPWTALQLRAGTGKFVARLREWSLPGWSLGREILPDGSTHPLILGF